MNLSINHKVGLKIKKCRNEMGISQEELANLADLHRTYIGQIERAEKNISILTLEKLSIALNTSPSELLNFDDLD